MVCLQVASAGDIVIEIANDLCSMQPVCEADTKSWGSGLHKNVFDVTYGLDARCQKYRNMFENYKEFYVVSIDHIKFLKGIETFKFDEEKYAEVLFANMTRSLYWKPLKKANKVLMGVKCHIKSVKKST